jgi:hypothetical protein
MFTESDIDHIGRGVESRTLPKAEWTHAAHFAALVWLMAQSTRVPELEMPELIRAYNEATGTPNTDESGYHETITQASIRVVRAFLRDRSDLSRAEALGKLLASRLGRSDWPLAHYSYERLFSVAARRSWVEPDLAPLPI